MAGRAGAHPEPRVAAETSHVEAVVRLVGRRVDPRVLDVQKVQLVRIDLALEPGHVLREELVEGDDGSVARGAGHPHHGLLAGFEGVRLAEEVLLVARRVDGHQHRHRAVRVVAVVDA